MSLNNDSMIKLSDVHFQTVEFINFFPKVI